MIPPFRIRTGSLAMSHIGILSFPAPGHFYPLTALGRKLKERGHRVTYFQVADAEPVIRAAGLEFQAIGHEDFPAGTLRKLDDALSRLSGIAGLRFTARRAFMYSRMVLRDAPGAVRASGVETMIIDQAEPSGGSVAEHLRLPYVNAVVTVPFNLDPSVPFFLFGWKHGSGFGPRLRNRLGNALFESIVSPIKRLVNDHRRDWGLASIRSTNEFFSDRAQISQLPASFEFPGRLVPPHFHYTGPWTDAGGRRTVEFPWESLDPSRPLVFASMGTLQNGDLRIFRVILEACEGEGVQLVLSLGGGLDPSELGPIPGDPIVVRFAPQLDLIRRASVAITHGGLNTVLECLTHGVPMVVLPVTNDQPGVGARVEWAKVGRARPVGKVDTAWLRASLREVMHSPTYRDRAATLKSSIEAVDGLKTAAGLVESALGLSRVAGSG
jgi:zeaxanthin glucosyltransferase